MTHPPTRRSRRVLASLAAGATLTSALVVTAAPAGAADAGAASSSSDWLASKLVDGLLPGPFSPVDYGLSLDAVYAMAASGDRALAEPILDALDEGEQAANYFSYAQWIDDGDQNAIAGATAKTLVAAQVGGRDPRDFGGYDLVQRTLDTVVTAADVAPGGRFAAGGAFAERGINPGDVGRVADFGPMIYSNEANTFGQSLAVIGLARAGRLTRPVVDKLLWQRCDAGYFRIFYSVRNDAGTITPVDCQDGIADDQGAPDRDSTGLALSALVAARAAGFDGLDAEIAETVAWLVSEQQANGGWGGGVMTEAPNTNSTGLVVQALADAGAPKSVLDAGTAYLASAQATAADSGTALAGEIGAIAYTPEAYVTAKEEGLTQEDTWIRATAQASLGLSQVGFRTLVGGIRLPAARLAVSAPTGYVLRGRAVTVRATGLRAGEGYTIAVGGRSVATGTANSAGVVGRSLTLPVVLAAGSRPVTVVGSQTDRAGSATVKVLTPVTLKVRVAPGRVRVRGKARVVVTRLAAHERVTVKVQGRTLRGRATASGTFAAKIRLTRAGRAKIVATGEFGVRRGVAKVRVVKR